MSNGILKGEVSKKCQIVRKNPSPDCMDPLEGQKALLIDRCMDPLEGMLTPIIHLTQYYIGD